MSQLKNKFLFHLLFYPVSYRIYQRFCNLLDKIVDETETYFLVVTHHRLTMAKMNRLFGVTMEQKGISRLVSVDLEQANKIKDIA